MSRSREWVVAVAAAIDPEEPRHHLLCQRCGGKVVPQLPMQISRWCAVANAFGLEHSGCKEKRRAD